MYMLTVPRAANCSVVGRIAIRLLVLALGVRMSLPLASSEFHYWEV
jgi:hypothetical protein